MKKTQKVAPPGPGQVKNGGVKQQPAGTSGTTKKLEGKKFAEIKAQCLRERRLFEDPDFPASNASIFPSKRPPNPFVWKRPAVSI